VHVTRAMQGDHPKYLKTVSCAKHFICNETDADRDYADAAPDRRSFWEYSQARCSTTSTSRWGRASDSLIRLSMEDMGQCYVQAMADISIQPRSETTFRMA